MLALEKYDVHSVAVPDVALGKLPPHKLQHYDFNVKNESYESICPKLSWFISESYEKCNYIGAAWVCWLGKLWSHHCLKV